MLLSALLALALLTPRLDAAAQAVPARIAALVPASATPRYVAEARAVSTWREEALFGLRPLGLSLIVRFAEREPAFVARCVKLNNYWCIKRAGWPGEIGADSEGHTAFAGAAEAADAAVALLARYYREYRRVSALAIVRRWAPAECGLPVVMRGGQPPRTPQVSATLAPRGIAGTARARYLARHFRGGAPRRVVVQRGRAPTLRVQPWSARARLAGRRPIPRLPLPALKPVPDIAAGLAERPSETSRTPLRVATFPASRDAPLSPDRLLAESAALPSIARTGGVSDLGLPPPPLCSGDEVRIANYAARIAGSVGLKAGDDLRLFGPDGAPLPNLEPVLLAMSAVELGTMRASPALVLAAIARRRGG